MPRQPNAKLGEIMDRAGCSNKSLAARVQAVAKEQGADLSCTHVDVRRWLDGVMPRPATAQYIAIALSRKAGFRVSVDDIGMGTSAGTTAMQSSLDYAGDLSGRLSGLCVHQLRGFGPVP
jgi:hypothetical protein